MGGPAAAPTPRLTDSAPIAVIIRPGGNVSRITPYASGNTPPATPWSTRPAIAGPRLPVRAQRIDPAQKMAATTASIRPRPYRSPSLPTSGVATAAARR